MHNLAGQPVWQGCGATYGLAADLWLLVDAAIVVVAGLVIRRLCDWVGKALQTP